MRKACGQLELNPARHCWEPEQNRHLGVTLLKNRAAETPRSREGICRLLPGAPVPAASCLHSPEAEGAQGPERALRLREQGAGHVLQCCGPGTPGWNTQSMAVKSGTNDQGS